MGINRGDVFYVNRSETIGSEQRSGRPAIIVSNPECNEHSPVVEVVYLTCQYKKPMPLMCGSKALVGALRPFVSRSPLWMSAGSATIRAI